MLLSFPQNARIKNRAVTALTWNSKFEDLFAVGYGSYDFPSKKEEKGELDDRQDDTMENGYIYVFSVKNNFYPEMKYTTESGVLSLDFHPKQFSYLVAGFYDGTVSVFDISQKIKTPIVTCDIRTQKHMDPVWMVKWYTHFTEPGEYVFYSISSDGRVIKWSFYNNKTKLETEEVVLLKYSDGKLAIIFSDSKISLCFKRYDSMSLYSYNILKFSIQILLIKKIIFDFSLISSVEKLFSFFAISL
jgi:dynein intermediate chain 1